MAVNDVGTRLAVAGTFGHKVNVLAIGTNAGEGTNLDLESGSYPYTCLFDGERKRLYVSLWAKGKIAVLDVTDDDKGRPTLKIATYFSTNPHPTEMLLSPKGKELYVAWREGDGEIAFGSTEFRGRTTLASFGRDGWIQFGPAPGHGASGAALFDDQGRAIGLINKCVPQSELRKETLAWCETIKGHSPQTLRMTKKSLNFESDLLYASWQHGMELLAHVWGSEESLEGMDAFLEGRKPDFQKFRMRNKRDLEDYLDGCAKDLNAPPSMRRK